MTRSAPNGSGWFRAISHLIGLLDAFTVGAKPAIRPALPVCRSCPMRTADGHCLEDAGVTTTDGMPALRSVVAFTFVGGDNARPLWCPFWLRSRERDRHERDATKGGAR